jgi:hypothetical protein
MCDEELVEKVQYSVILQPLKRADLSISKLSVLIISYRRGNLRNILRLWGTKTWLRQDDYHLVDITRPHPMSVASTRSYYLLIFRRRRLTPPYEQRSPITLGGRAGLPQLSDGVI